MGIHRTRRGAAVAAALVVGLVGIAGCGNGAKEPAPLDETSEQGGENDQSGGDADGGGDAGGGDTDQGDGGGGGSKGDAGGSKQGPLDPVDDATADEVEKVAVQFIKAYDQGARTGDFSTFDSLYTDACETCAEYSGNLKEIYDEGGRIEGGAFRPEMQAKAEGKGEDGRIHVKVDATATAYTNYDSSGKVLDSDEEKKEEQLIWFSQDQGDWRVVWWV